MFAPTLFIGAMIGGAVGGIKHHFFPWLTGSVGAYALVGMGTLFAGFLRVPMTSVFMILEVSGNYSIILPVMISNTIAYLISRQYERVPIFDLLSRQDGLDLPSMEERREEVTLRLEDALQPYRGPVLNPEDSLASDFHRAEPFDGPVLVANELGEWFAISKNELRDANSGNRENDPLKSVLSLRRLPYAHPDQPLSDALHILGGSPVLPVVSRADFGKLEGVVSLTDILRSYRSGTEEKGG